jgi:hypothetical protein
MSSLRERTAEENHPLGPEGRYQTYLPRPAVGALPGRAG